MVAADNNDREPDEAAPENDFPQTPEISGGTSRDMMPRSLTLTMTLGAVLGIGFWLALTQLLVRCS
jgi:hypothetical protein